MLRVAAREHGTHTPRTQDPRPRTPTTQASITQTPGRSTKEQLFSKDVTSHHQDKPSEPLFEAITIESLGESRTDDDTNDHHRSERKQKPPVDLITQRDRVGQQETQRRLDRHNGQTGTDHRLHIDSHDQHQQRHDHNAPTGSDHRRDQTDQQPACQQQRIISSRVLAAKINTRFEILSDKSSHRRKRQQQNRGKDQQDPHLPRHDQTTDRKQRNRYLMDPVPHDHRANENRDP